MFLLLAGGLLVILFAVVIAVVSSVVSAVAADTDEMIEGTSYALFIVMKKRGNRRGSSVSFLNKKERRKWKAD